MDHLTGVVGRGRPSKDIKQKVENYLPKERLRQEDVLDKRINAYKWFFVIDRFWNSDI